MWLILLLQFARPVKLMQTPFLSHSRFFSLFLAPIFGLCYHTFSQISEITPTNRTSLYTNEIFEEMWHVTFLHLPFQGGEQTAGSRRPGKAKGLHLESVASRTHERRLPAWSKAAWDRTASFLPLIRLLHFLIYVSA